MIIVEVYASLVVRGGAIASSSVAPSSGAVSVSEIIVTLSGVSEAHGSADLVSIIASDTTALSSLLSSLMKPSISPVVEVVSSCSTFLLFHKFPFGAGSSGVLQYVTVLVTTCLTLTLPGWPLVSALASLVSKDALQGAELSGVETYGDAIVCAEPGTGEKGDCGM